MQGIEELTRTLAAKLLAGERMLVTAESCSGGLIAKSCTDLAGSSAWFERGFVTYSNQSKCDMLGVREQSLELYGAVSKEVVREMAAGALTNSRADISVAVTGIAGPGGGCMSKPVGTVWFGFAWKDTLLSEMQFFDGDRQAIRQQTLVYAIRRLTDILG
jgi:nicotinamide-nucleotide amidase